MRLEATLLLLITVRTAACAPRPTAPAVSAPRVDVDAIRRAIANVLDDMHDAAAHADEARYFAHFADDAVFLGTDAKERWDLPAFRAFAHPYFTKGKAWSFRAVRRVVTLARDGDLAWFDEDLATEKLGPARGSGVLVRGPEGAWKVVQYNLATVIPNERFAAARAAIDRSESAREPPFSERYERAQARIVEQMKQGDYAAAEGELRALATACVVPLAPSCDPDGEYPGVVIGIHDLLAWLRWSGGDLAGAYAQLDAAHERSSLAGNMSVAIRVDRAWSRAFFLREMAALAPPTLRVDALATAKGAREEYEKSALSIGRQDAVAALRAFFAVRAGDAKGALAAEKDPSLAGGEKGPVELYVLASVYDLAKDRAQGDATRAALRALPKELMTLVVLRRMDLDAAQAKAR
jgi:SnoaL-like domain